MSDSSNSSHGKPSTPSITALGTSILAVNLNALANKQETANQALARLESAPCETPEQEQFFSSLLGMVQRELKELEEERKELTRPLLEAKAEVDQQYKPAFTAWDAVKDLVKRKLSDAQTKRLQAAQAARKEAEDAAVMGDREGVLAAMAKIPETSKPEGVSVQFEWVPYIVDANEIPREFLEVSLTAVKNYCRAHAKQEEIAPIPGLRFEKKAKVTPR